MGWCRINVIVVSKNEVFMMRILVDGDACPLKEKICRIGIEYDLEVLIFISVAHWSFNKVEARYITVDNNYQEVDIKIVNEVEKNDIVITNDYGLAALILKKDAYVLSNYGRIFTEERINYLLSKRYFNAKMRRQGKYLSGPGKFGDRDREDFTSSLISLIADFK